MLVLPTVLLPHRMKADYGYLGGKTVVEDAVQDWRQSPADTIPGLTQIAIFQSPRYPVPPHSSGNRRRFQTDSTTRPSACKTHIRPTFDLGFGGRKQHTGCRP